MQLPSSMMVAAIVRLANLLPGPPTANCLIVTSLTSPRSLISQDWSNIERFAACRPWEPILRRLTRKSLFCVIAAAVCGIKFIFRHTPA